MENPLVSIIILNYNGGDFVKSCLSSVLKNSYPNFEVIFVDNASTDESLDKVRKCFKDPRLKFVLNQENLGYAEGNNRGAGKAKGEFLIFLNNDMIVTPNFLKGLVRTMMKNPEAGAVQAKIMMLPNKNKIDSTGGFIDSYGWSYIRGKGEKTGFAYKRIDEIFFASSPLVRKKLFEFLGGFDSKFFLSAEETDLCWRMRLIGYKILYVPTSVIYHVGKAVIRKQPSQMILFHALKNNITMLFKNYSFKNLVKRIPVAVFIVLGGAFKGKKGRGTAHLSAIFWNLVNFKYIWKERLKIQKMRKVSDDEIEKLMLRKPLFIHHLFNN